ncbi:MAG: AEC family transporter [Lachnospiraceae bacterium]|nr:AEC family transporter [Lachnospiraceae bacterium]
MNMLTLIFEMVVIFILVMVGYIACRKEVFDEHAQKSCSWIVVNVCNPCMMLNAAISLDHRMSMATLIEAILVSGFMFAVLILGAFLIPPLMRIPDKERYTFKMLSIFGNIGFIGLPVCSAVLGNESLIYVTVGCLLYNLIFYTLGIYVLSKAKNESEAEPGQDDGELQSPRPAVAMSEIKTDSTQGAELSAASDRKAESAPGAEFGAASDRKTGSAQGAEIGASSDRKAANAPGSRAEAKSNFNIRELFNMGTISSVIAVFIYLYDPQFPMIINDVVEYSANATVFLSMAVLGGALALSGFRALFGNKRMYLFLLIRMLVLPVVIVTVLRVFITDPLVLGTLAVMSSLPGGNLPLMRAKEIGLNGEELSQGILLSTAACIFTIPVVCAFL